MFYVPHYSVSSDVFVLLTDFRRHHSLGVERLRYCPEPYLVYIYIYICVCVCVYVCSPLRL